MSDLSSTGTLYYHNHRGISKIIVVPDDDLVERYRKKVVDAKLAELNFLPHIAISKGELSTINLPPEWGKYDGRVYHFRYDPYIRNNGTIWWLNIHSSEFILLRMSMSLKPYNFLTKPPNGDECFHLMIGTNINV